MSFASEVNAALEDVRKEHDVDFLVYVGVINRRGADRVSRQLEGRKHKHLILLLCTTGGDSHAAFKIARTCQFAYGTVPPREHFKPKDHPRLTVCVPTLCKSAGTIIALGADDVMMAGEAELGPIDIQLRKPEEVGELTSTLTPVQAIQSLQRQMTTVFVDVFSTLRFDEKLAFSTKMAGEIARDLAGAIVAPIAGQLDPYRLAETERLLKISSEYGDRLNSGANNLKEGALFRLLSAYPSHGFVIDRAEAMTLFNRVDKPSASVRRLSKLLEFLYRSQADLEDPFVRLIELVDDPDGGNQNDKAADSDGSKESDGSSVGNDGEGGPEVREADRPKTARKEAKPRR